MPHLSPMSWITILLCLWTFMLIIYTFFYFMSSLSFIKPLNNSKSMKSASWFW